MIPAFVGLSRSERRELLRYLARQNALYSSTLHAIPEKEWPPARPGFQRPIAVFRSCDYMCQVFSYPNGGIRLTFNRTAVDEATWTWKDGITWDDLQRLKREAGYGERQAVEVFPPDSELVNVASMRHLWILPTPVPVGLSG